MRRRHAAILTAALLFGAAGCGTSGTAADRPARRAPDNPSTTKTPAPSTTTKPAARPAVAAPATPNVCPYRDLGAWVDVYDYVPAFAEHGAVAPVTPASAIATMRAHVVHTLYLQVAKDDPRSPGIITDAAKAAEFLQRAHAAGIKVVAWYLPTHRDPQLDRARVFALTQFRAGRERFDGIALDIEGTEVVKDVAVRNARLLDLVTGLDRAAGSTPIGAIVYPPVAFDVLNPTLWPNFPWAQLAPHVDVWLPMAYWSYRSLDSPYHDAYRYVTENVQRLRAHVGNANAPVHVIGGLAEDTTAPDINGMQRATREQRAIGLSIYDLNTTSVGAWPLLAVPSTC